MEVIYFSSNRLSSACLMKQVCRPLTDSPTKIYFRCESECLIFKFRYSNGCAASLSVIWVDHKRSGDAVSDTFKVSDTYSISYTLSFSSKKELITSASNGDVQKHSIASRGVQTMGSPLVLNEVFTSTGTPVIFLNSCNNA